MMINECMVEKDNEEMGYFNEERKREEVRENYCVPWMKNCFELLMQNRLSNK